jgi:GDP-mannose 6-dehydrogenase
MNISIFGLGYVGSVSLGCLAKDGHEVVGVDLLDAKINFINEGKSPIVEKEIDTIIAEEHELGKISATNDGVSATKTTDISFICVGTPSTNNGHLHLNAVFKVVEEIGKGIKEKNSFHIVVIRSTVPPGTNENVTKIIEEVSGKECNKDFSVVSNPEFLREGTAVKDFYNPPCTLIGSNDDKPISLLKTLYEGVSAPFIVTDIKVAEMIKYANNAFHALKISFANEIGNICKSLDIDSHELMKIFCMDKKLNLSEYYLTPGFAYGGSCLPKDLKALKTIAHDHYLSCPLLENLEKSNQCQKELVLDKILAFEKRNIGFLGLSFKSGTDDLRESPIIDIMERLIGKGYNILVYDKFVHLSQLFGANKEYILKKIPLISKLLTDDPKTLIEGSDVLVIVNNDDEYKQILGKASKNVTVYDLVNLDFKNRNGVNYEGLAW